LKNAPSNTHTRPAGQNGFAQRFFAALLALVGPTDFLKKAKKTALATATTQPTIQPTDAAYGEHGAHTMVASPYCPTDEDAE